MVIDKMIASAKLKYIRISPRKVDQVIKVVRNKPVGYALSILSSLNKRASQPVSKILKSALSNAKNKGVDTTKLNDIYISKIIVNAGPTLKRFRAAAFGRAVLIRKRTSHIEIELDSKLKQ